MLRPVLPAVRPFRAGAICLFVARHARPRGRHAGLGPGGTRPDWWDAEWVKTRGGMVGETLDWVVDDARSARRRAHPRGLPVPRRRAAADRRVGRGRDQGDARLGVHDDARAARRGRSAAAAAAAARTWRRSSSRRACASSGRRRRRAAGVRAPSPSARSRKPAERRSFWSGEERFPDLYGGEPPSPSRSRAEPEPTSRARRRARAPRRGPGRGRAGRHARPAEPVDPEQLTPQGRYRARGHRLARLRLGAARTRRMLTRSSRGGRAPGHRRPGEGRRAADRGARALRRRGAA